MKPRYSLALAAIFAFSSANAYAQWGNTYGPRYDQQSMTWRFHYDGDGCRNNDHTGGTGTGTQGPCGPGGPCVPVPVPPV